jgi:three-Cys-motif partner protein
MLITMSAGAMQKYQSWPRQYTVVDLNAGPGRYRLSTGAPVDGTPLLILRRLAAAQLSTWRAAFVEQDADMAEELRGWLAEEAANLGVNANQYCVLQGNHANVVMPWVARSVPAARGLGLLLHDPNGAPDFLFLEQLAHEPQLSRFDVAVYVQATPLKRVRGLDPDRYDVGNWRRLDEALSRVKPHWVVREPNGSNQYALCIGSNGRIPGTWTRQHFWPSDSERGRAILDQLALTTSERHRRLQPSLWGDAERWT